MRVKPEMAKCICPEPAEVNCWSGVVFSAGPLVRPRQRANRADPHHTVT